jgi:hypothetical protein
VFSGEAANTSFIVVKGYRKVRVSSIDLVSVFMIFRIDFGNVPTMWYYCFNFISTVQHNVHVILALTP